MPTRFCSIRMPLALVRIGRVRGAEVASALSNGCVYRHLMMPRPVGGRRKLSPTPDISLTAPVLIQGCLCAELLYTGLSDV